ncbi:unannotated protein [freshwater metagenome]|uniref:Unannotated protein n=1 Tax=freshwater metagenome TaxID=449393 RepID=A0A6J6V066_9ZZZZ
MVIDAKTFELFSPPLRRIFKTAGAREVHFCKFPISNNAFTITYPGKWGGIGEQRDEFAGAFEYDAFNIDARKWSIHIGYFVRNRASTAQIPGSSVPASAILIPSTPRNFTQPL